MATLKITATCERVEMDLPYTQEDVERFCSDAIDQMLCMMGNYGVFTYEVVIQKEEGGSSIIAEN